MKYFDSDAHFARLVRELESWKGTPFSKGRSCIKGRAANCCNWVAQALENIGAISPVVMPPGYVTRGGGDRMLEVILATMATIPELRRVWKAGEPGAVRSEILRGDVLLFSTGKALHHLAIVTEPPVCWHCLAKVEQGNITDAQATRRLFAHYVVK